MTSEGLTQLRLGDSDAEWERARRDNTPAGEHDDLVDLDATMTALDGQPWGGPLTQLLNLSGQASRRGEHATATTWLNEVRQRLIERGETPQRADALIHAYTTANSTPS